MPAELDDEKRAEPPGWARVCPPADQYSGTGPAGDKFRAQRGTQDTVGGSEVQQAAISGEANGVPRLPAAAARSSNAQLISAMTTQAFRR